MYLKKENFIILFQKHFDGNYNKCGRLLSVSPAQVYRIVNGQGQAGIVFLSKLINYCDKNIIDYKDYIFLPESLTVCNKRSRSTYDLKEELKK